jgi:hypothetical protein
MTAVIASGARLRDAGGMTTVLAIGVDEQLSVQGTGSPEAQPALRLRPIMRQGTASSIPETWRRFPTLAEARQAVKQMYHDDRVLRVFIVADTAPPRFVEWVER